MPKLAGKPITQNGLGLMRLTSAYFQLSDEETFKVLRAALNAGVNYWNGADYYGSPDANSLHLMNRYFTKYPDDAEKVVLSIKTGIADRVTNRMDCSEANLRTCIDNAIAILDGKKTIDVFGIALVDPEVPIERSMQALAQFKAEGLIRGIALNEVSTETLRRASKVCNIDMLEAEASLMTPHVFENGVAETCAELGIVLVAHSPLGRGALGGAIKSLDDMATDNPFRVIPRYHPDTYPQNAKFVEAIRDLASAKGCSLPQFALNWVRCQSKRPGFPVVVTIAGARSGNRVVENTVQVDLVEEDLVRVKTIQKEYPIAGARCVPSVMDLMEI